MIAGVAGIAGALMEWVTVRPPPVLPEAERLNARPFTGLDVVDGWWVVAAAIVLIVAAPLLLVRRTSGWGWLSFLASVLIGGIAFADFRAIGDFHSGLMQRTEVVGEVDPALGIMLVAAAGITGVIASVLGIAATPRTDQDR